MLCEPSYEALSNAPFISVMRSLVMQWGWSLIMANQVAAGDSLLLRCWGQERVGTSHRKIRRTPHMLLDRDMFSPKNWVGHCGPFRLIPITCLEQCLPNIKMWSFYNAICSWVIAWNPDVPKVIVLSDVRARALSQARHRPWKARLLWLSHWSHKPKMETSSGNVTVTWI